MIDLFFEHAPGRVQGGRSGLDGGDLELAERSAHPLKSSAANLGADPPRNLFGQIEETIKALALGGLVAETLAQMEGQVGGKPVALRSEISEESESFITDAGKLNQVIINLVGNALKFTEAGEVTVQVEAGDGGKVPQRIHVRYTGPGIPRDRLATIFEAFLRADGSTTSRFGGTGLVLSISRSLCDLMGYRVTVSSEPGKGSTFTIYLVGAGTGDNAEELRALDEPPQARWAPTQRDPRSAFRQSRGSEGRLNLEDPKPSA